MTVEQALALVQDYDNHKNIYKPEVMESKLISHDGNDFKIFLRLLKKKIITVVLDTDHDVHYCRARCQALVLPLLSPRASPRWKTPARRKRRCWSPIPATDFLWRLVFLLEIRREEWRRDAWSVAPSR